MTRARVQKPVRDAVATCPGCFHPLKLVTLVGQLERRECVNPSCAWNRQRPAGWFAIVEGA